VSAEEYGKRSLATTACPVCGHGERPEANFCSRCGAPLQEAGRAEPIPLAAPSAEGERRQLTVAFCDLVGSTELSTRLDAEEYGELIHSYQRSAVDAMSSYAGETEKFLGDGIVFRFGWPQAHDDDAERAIRGALDVVDAVAALNADTPADQRLAVRIGIHTGPVVIGGIGTSETETMALGETLNVAARLQGVAAPETVVISPATLELVQGIFVTEDLGPQSLRGIAEPIWAHRAVQPSGVRSRLDAARDSLTEFVNREAELGILANRWRRAQAQSGQAVLITGEPGVGKSRLIYQLREQLREEPHSWLECRCSSYTQQSAFRPAIELIEQGLSLEADDPPEERLAKLERGMAAAGVASEDAVPLLATLLSVPVADSIGPLTMSPERRRRRTIEVLVEWVLALARLQPVVLLAEDLHWCDPSSLELFGEILGQGRGCGLMLVATARPEFEPPWPPRPWLTMLSVGPLPDSEIRTLIGLMSGGRALPDEVLDRVVGETDGIPLYAEEIGRMVLESDALVAGEQGFELTAPLASIDIPTTLQGSLMARLDRLSAAKRVAQRAAVIGREFDYELLVKTAGLEETVLRGGLERLVDGDMLYQSGVLPRATYTFKHALIQDAAYQSLLKRTRRELHERIAETLEEALGEDPTAAPEIVARHYEAAGRIESAIDNYQRAAEHAALQSAHTEAMAHYRRAIHLLASLPEEAKRDEREMDMQLALGSSIISLRGFADPEVEAAYERARALCGELADDAKVASALAGLSIFYLNRGRLDLGMELAGRVLEIGERADDDTLRLLGHVHLALPDILQTRFTSGLDHAERAIAIYDPDRHRAIAFRVGTDQGVVARCFRGWALFGLGYLDRALESMDDAIALARRLGHPFSIAYAHFFALTLHWVRGDRPAQRATADAVLAISEEQGFDFWTGLGRVYRGAERAVVAGEREAIPEIIEGSLVAGESGNLLGSTPVLACVAEAQRAVGQISDALGTLDGALAVSEQTAQPWWDSELHRVRGELLLEAGDGEPDEAARGRAERRLQRALEIAREQHFAVHELRAATSLARFWAGRGDRAQAAELLRPLYERFTEGFETVPLSEARELLVELGADVAKPSHHPA
jgi:class 3 adenylate cyclase/predicted ATPase